MSIPGAKKSVAWSLEERMIREFEILEQDSDDEELENQTMNNWKKDNLKLFSKILEDSFTNKEEIYTEGVQGIGITFPNERIAMAFKRASDKLNLGYNELSEREFALEYDDIMNAVYKFEGEFDDFKEEFIKHYQAGLKKIPKEDLDLFAGVLKESFKDKEKYSIEGILGIGIVLPDEVHTKAFKHTLDKFKIKFNELSENTIALVYSEIWELFFDGNFDGMKAEFVKHYQTELKKESLPERSGTPLLSQYQQKKEGETISLREAACVPAKIENPQEALTLRMAAMRTYS